MHVFSNGAVDEAQSAAKMQGRKNAPSHEPQILTAGSCALCLLCVGSIGNTFNLTLWQEHNIPQIRPTGTLFIPNLLLSARCTIKLLMASLGSHSGTLGTVDP